MKVSKRGVGMLMLVLVAIACAAGAVWLLVGGY